MPNSVYSSSSMVWLPRLFSSLFVALSFSHPFPLYPHAQRQHQRGNRGKMANVSDVIIVGAGISGLVSALHLLETHGVSNITILEGRGRVGGRLQVEQGKSVLPLRVGPKYRKPTTLHQRWCLSSPLSLGVVDPISLVKCFCRLPILFRALAGLPRPYDHTAACSHTA